MFFLKNYHFSEKVSIFVAVKIQLNKKFKGLA